MKYKPLFIGLLSAIAISCSVDEIPATEESSGFPVAKVLQAIIDDEPDGVDTRTFADDQLRILWYKDDRITVFNKVTAGLEYSFSGEDGDAGGDFELVPSTNLSGGTDIDSLYAIYPHQKDTKISLDKRISFTFPSVQTYQKNSFGRDANAMVARSDNILMKFKNVGGYLSLRLYGNNVSVSSIYLEAKGGQKLAGKGSISVNPEGLPVVTMDDDSDNTTNKIQLECGGIKLGPSSDKCTEFWFVLPPVNFSAATGGFEITVTTTDGGIFTQQAKTDLVINRNARRRMAPLEVKPDYTASSDLKINEIYATRAAAVSDNSGATAVNENYKYTADYSESDETYTITIPTLTDFAHVILNYSLKEGDILMYNGEEIESGVTPVDASGIDGATLVLCRGILEKQFTLKAQNTGLPVVRITTPEGVTQATIENDSEHETWFAGATIHIDNADGTVDLDDTPMNIKGRGNVTWKYPKKPFALKFDSKVSLLDMNKDKKWILLANWRDRTLLRNDAAFWLSKRSGLAYTVNGQFVELEFNGVHRGNYYLCEQIKISKDRVNITEMKEGYTDKTGGFLMEIDSYYDELRKFKSAEFNLKYMFKDPDVDADADTVFNGAYAWMKDYINRFEKVLKTKSDVVNHLYEDYLDVDSAIWFMLVNEVTENRDFFQGMPESVYGPHSTYLYKDTDKKGGKLVMGPVWDFDYETFVPAKWFNNSWGNGSYAWRGFDKSGYYYYYLCYDKKFRDRVKELWDGFKADDLLKQDFRDYIDKMAAKISLSQEFDDEMWPYIGNHHSSGVLSQQNDNHDYYENGKVVPFQTAISRMKDSFDARVDWMDNKIQNLQQTNPSFKY